MPKSTGKGAGCHFSQGIPDAAAKISRAGTEPVQGAPQQAEGGAQLPAWMPRGWCWWQGTGLFGNSLHWEGASREQGCGMGLWSCIPRE